MAMLLTTTGFATVTPPASCRAAPREALTTILFVARPAAVPWERRTAPALMIRPPAALDQFEAALEAASSSTPLSFL